MGKGWAKGLTAKTDPRIARAAAGHRGKQYVRRTPPELCRWSLAGLTTLPLAWSDDMAYIVGLTATDGCLITGGARSTSNQATDSWSRPTYVCSVGRIASRVIRRRPAASPTSRSSTTQLSTNGSVGLA